MSVDSVVPNPLPNTDNRTNPKEDVQLTHMVESTPRSTREERNGNT